MIPHRMPFGHQPFGGQPSQPVCENCSGPLQTHIERHEGFCRRIECRGPCIHKMAEKTRLQKVAERESRDAFATSVRNTLQHELGDQWTEDHGELLIVVPFFEGSLVTPPASRIETFRTHLEKILHDAESELSDQANHDVLKQIHADRAIEAQTSLRIINACTTCRGKCCAQGGEHAFLKSEFMAWRMLQESEKSPEDLLHEYLSIIPEEAYEDSCLYHSVNGCVLPREIRSNTCNGFLCTGLSDMRMQIHEQPNAASVAAAVSVSTCHRAGLMTTDGQRTEVSLNVTVAAKSISELPTPETE